MSALELATRAVLRAIRNKDFPPECGQGGPYIWAFRDDGDGSCDAGVFDAARFAVHDPERYTAWIMGKPDPEGRSLNPPHASDREAITLLPPRLQKRIKNHEKQNPKDNESSEN
jgi:hypothetical protein